MSDKFTYDTSWIYDDGGSTITLSQGNRELDLVFAGDGTEVMIVVRDQLNDIGRWAGIATNAKGLSRVLSWLSTGDRLESADGLLMASVLIEGPVCR